MATTRSASNWRRSTRTPRSGAAVMYKNGLGVPQDYVQAHMWYNLAASRSPRAEDRDKAVKGRDTIAKRMTPSQISKAEKMAREWKPK